MIKGAKMLGVYEKSMPDKLEIENKLDIAKLAGFDFMEISIDESDKKQKRLYDLEFWKKTKSAIEEANMPILTMCLSGHRKYPLGSLNEETRNQALDIMQKAIDFSIYIGIRIIQLAGYDVFYEESTEQTKKYFETNLKKCVAMAAEKGVILAFETMETPFMNSIEKAMKYVKSINSPYLQVYPDIGNIRNATDNYLLDIECGRGHIAAAHLKETIKGVYRDMQFGEGRIDFKGCIEALKEQGVNLFNCEFWYDGKSEPLSYLKNAREFFKELI
jgi:L-ribulose-5-phosphate 3-epimerase